MDKVNNKIISPVKLTKDDGQYFFGYYDIPAFSKSCRYHLCHRVQFRQRLPVKEDVAELGMIDIDTKEFIKLAETTAWNFQQGAMLQWNPSAPDDEIIYNVRDGEAYRGIIQNIHSGQKRVLEMPVANVDSSGRYALSINFNRLYDYRPGYGYAGVIDAFKDEKHPSGDGIFLVDLHKGSAKLIISLEDIWQRTKGSLGCNEEKILINHITFNTDSTRFVFLARYFGEPPIKTAILTANTDGSDIYVLSDYSYASHYNWRDPNYIVFYAVCAEGSGEGKQLYLIKDKSHEVEIIDREFFKADGHCNYSPDRKWLLYDSYPDKENYRHLYLFNLAKKKGIVLGSYYHDPAFFKTCIDIRCDLHPRWSPDGGAITFDSIHDGRRQVYYLDLTKVKREFV